MSTAKCTYVVFSLTSTIFSSPSSFRRAQHSYTGLTMGTCWTRTKLKTTPRAVREYRGYWCPSMAGPTTGTPPATTTTPQLQIEPTYSCSYIFVHGRISILYNHNTANIFKELYYFKQYM